YPYHPNLHSFPTTTLFRSTLRVAFQLKHANLDISTRSADSQMRSLNWLILRAVPAGVADRSTTRAAGICRAMSTRVAEFDAWPRSEEHTSELQSLAYLVCR